MWKKLLELLERFYFSTKVCLPYNNFLSYICVSCICAFSVFTFYFTIKKL